MSFFLFEEIQRNISEAIDRYNRINKLIEHRNSFLKTKEELEKALSELSQEVLNEKFETANYSLILTHEKNRYNDGIKISNAGLIVDFIEMLNSKIDGKVKELETQILN